ncbi:hypothetical protein NM688_g8002 [Phlebia brevispora]|uniref:Uncharacterized protein n=1 Tax=Phlebia brevispora TaxID=194682 RepID=A0ACC1RYW1_9APHY|nr:hypothetical protein NM688_g8002 [Phlebia brevispora]
MAFRGAPAGPSERHNPVREHLVTRYRMEPPDPARATVEASVDGVHPFVKQDLQEAETVPLDQWISAVLKLPRDRLNSWASKIGELKWFEDDIVQSNLKKYCIASEEDLRYDPFVSLANRVIQLARGKIPGIRKSKSYPVDTIQFVENSTHHISRIPEHRGLGAKRKLDVLVTHGKAAQTLKDNNRIAWVDILQWWELKKAGAQLVTELSDERVSRGMTKLDKKGREVVAAISPPPKPRTKSKSKAAARKKNTGVRRAKPVATDPQPAPKSAPKTGSKRPKEEDLLAKGSSRDSNGSSKRGNSSSFSQEIEVGQQAATQSGAYALEVLSCTYGTRVFCHGVVLKDDKLTLWYYDASGIVYTKQFLSLVHDFEMVAALIIGIASCTPEQFGAFPPSIMKPPTPYPRSFPPANLEGNVLQLQHPDSGKRIRLTLKESLYTQYVLLGRRTFAYVVDTSPALSTNGLIAKFAYQASTRKAEHDLVSVARSAGVKHLPTVHMWADLWKVSDGIRKIILSDNEDQGKYEDRTLRMIVYSRYAPIKKLFTDHCNLIPLMVEQMLGCLHDLRYKAGILHRDISVNNIMYEMRGGKYYFILIDFDMAVILPTDPNATYIASSRHRTGTLPFMSWELIDDAAGSSGSSWKPIRHLLRHDYESLFWVALWCILVLLTRGLDSEARKSSLGLAKLLEASDLAMVASKKKSICERTLKASRINLPPLAQDLADWFYGWWRIFKRANGARSDWEERCYDQEKRGESPELFDEETLNGIFTKDALNAVLSPLMPFKQDDVEIEVEIAEGPMPDAAVEASGPLELAKAQRQTRAKPLTEEQSNIRAGVLARLRPRKKTP